MTPIELAALTLSFGAVLSRFALPPIAPWLLAGAALAVIAGLAVNPARWPLYPAVIGLALLALIVLQPQRFGVGFAIAVAALLALSAALASLFAVPSLPAPTGPLAVGTATYTLDRAAEQGRRRLFLKIWYPAREPNTKPEGLWNDLRTMADVPWYFRWSLAYLHRTPTHSHFGAPHAGSNGPVAVVLYNHSFVSWASENSLLAEELASRGQVVIAIRHLGQADEYRELDARVEDAERLRGRTLEAELARAMSREERARLSQQLAEVGVASEIVRRRTEDARFVADRLGEILKAIPQLRGTVPISYTATGFSLGGAVSTSLCVSDPRCRAVANIDGAGPGLDYDRLRIPQYLMIYGGTNIGGSDRVRNGTSGAYEELIFADAAHGDFHDAAIALPVMRWFLGRSVEAVDGERRRVADAVADLVARASP